MMDLLRTGDPTLPSEIYLSPLEVLVPSLLCPTFLPTALQLLAHLCALLFLPLLPEPSSYVAETSLSQLCYVPVPQDRPIIDIFGEWVRKKLIKLWVDDKKVDV